MKGNASTVDPLRIAQLAPLHESVPPARYGGSERVVSWLVEELARRGHQVTLFASRCSTTRATLVPVVDHARRLAACPLDDPLAWHFLQIGLARERAAEFDVIHSHLDYWPFPAFRNASVPLLTTLHGRLDICGLPDIYRYYRDLPLVSISQAQRDCLPDAHWLANIYHGLPLHDCVPGPGDGGYFVFLGRIAPEKRPDVAIRIARQAGVRLKIAAKVDRQYFTEVVEPLLGDPLIEFVGEVGDRDKADLLRHATALLFPILWPEPFGLTMIEAMAYGTPVITRRCGSTPEVVAHGRVGYVCDSDDELLDAVKRVEQLDRSECRRWVERRFTVERMADDYEAVYRLLVETRRAESAAKRTLHLPVAGRAFGGVPPTPEHPTLSVRPWTATTLDGSWPRHFLPGNHLTVLNVPPQLNFDEGTSGVKPGQVPKSDLGTNN